MSKTMRAASETGEASPVWVSPSMIAGRLGISRSQVSRLATRAGWKRLSVTTNRGSKSGGVRYLLQDVVTWEAQNSF